MTDILLYNQILNRKVLGIHYAVKGNSDARGACVAQMMVARFRYKRARKQILKIENIKNFYRIKKYYEEMTLRRINLL